MSHAHSKHKEHGEQTEHKEHKGHKEYKEKAEVPPFSPPPLLGEPLCLVHHHPGYLRARANVFVQPMPNGHATPENPALTAARAAAEGTNGFRKWSHNPQTGSIVVEYEPGVVDSDDLLKHISASAGLHGVETAGPTKKVTREELVQGFLDFVQNMNGAARQAMGGKADLRELAPAALVVTSLISFIFHDERNRMPRWDSALYHAYRLFWNWHREEINERLRNDWKKSQTEANKEGSSEK